MALGDDRRPRPDPKSIGDLAATAPGSAITGDASVRISDIQYDSRLVRPGDLFVALRGGYVDGHDFAADAVNRGGIAVMAEAKLPLDVTQITVDDTRRRLAPVAAAFFDQPSESVDVVGITGTDGKTTTSYLAETILEHAGFKTGVMGTVSVRVGDMVLDADARQTTPESLDIQRHLFAMRSLGVDVAIVEATSHGLALHRLDATRFRVAAVTNITHEHLEYHGTVEAYRRAKAILFERTAAAGGRAVVNLDDAGARQMLDYVGGAAVLTYGIERDGADLVARQIRVNTDGTRFQLHGRATEIDGFLPLLGEYNVANALCAIGIGTAYDISLVDAINAFAHTPQVPGRLAIVRRGQPFTVVVDYAHTPESIEKVLRLLRSLTPNGRLLIVMGSAGERDMTKRALQGAVAAQLADYAVFTTEDPRFEDADKIIADIGAGAIGAGAREDDDFVSITDRRRAIYHAIERAKPGDCVLLAGKGHERSIIWGIEKRPWDEEAVAWEALARCGYTDQP